MEMSWDLETASLCSDWSALFGGQLLTAPTADPSEGRVQCDQRDVDDSVVDLWPSDESPGQLVGGGSPVSEIPLDSIWTLDDVDVGDPYQLAALLKKESHLNGEDFCSISTKKSFFISEDTYDNSSEYLASISDSSPVTSLTRDTGSSPAIDSSFEYGDITGSIADYSYSPRSTSLVEDGESQISYHISAESPSLQHESSLAIVPQEVPSSFESDLDCFECDSDPLRDAESVCEILRQLAHGGQLDMSTLTRRSLLAAVSPEEVESVLSRDSSHSNLEALQAPIDIPLSLDQAHVVGIPISSEPDSSLTSRLTSAYLGHDASLKAKSSRVTTPAPAPYMVEDKSVRRSKKKEQNKTAALRYRQKKREEKGVAMTEVEVLEQKNSELKARAEDLTREINYLKGLLEEIQRP